MNSENRKGYRGKLFTCNQFSIPFSNFPTLADRSIFLRPKSYPERVTQYHVQRYMYNKYKEKTFTQYTGSKQNHRPQHLHS